MLEYQFYNNIYSLYQQNLFSLHRFIVNSIYLCKKMCCFQDFILRYLRIRHCIYQTYINFAPFFKTLNDLVKCILLGFIWKPTNRSDASHCFHRKFMKSVQSLFYYWLLQYFQRIHYTWRSIDVDTCIWNISC